MARHGCTALAIVKAATQISHVPETSKITDKDPAVFSENGLFRNHFSEKLIALPINRIGCGRFLGSPISRSRKNAAGSTHSRKESLISSQHLLITQPLNKARSILAHALLAVGVFRAILKNRSESP